MSDLDALRRLAIYSSVLALIIAVPATATFYGAFGWDIESGTFGIPSAILDRGVDRAALLRWGAIGDMFFSYLLLVPLALFLHRRLRPKKPWLADLGAVGAFAYIFVGGAGAAMLATVGSSLVEAHATAAPADRTQIAISFDVLRNVVFFGLWQMLDPITAGAWVLSIGWLLLDERRAVAVFLLMLGIGLFGMSLMTMLGIHSIPLLGAEAAVILAVWAGWVIIDRSRARSRPLSGEPH